MISQTSFGCTTFGVHHLHKMLKSVYFLLIAVLEIYSVLQYDSSVRDNFIRFKYENHAWCERTGLERNEADLDKVGIFHVARVDCTCRLYLWNALCSINIIRWLLSQKQLTLVEWS